MGVGSILRGVGSVSATLTIAFGGFVQAAVQWEARS
jgi:hypothetical protein